MTIAIVLVGVALYIGLAMAVGRFCGLNSAWERAVEEAMSEKAAAARPEPQKAEVFDMSEASFDPVRSQPQEKDTAVQLVQ